MLDDLAMFIQIIESGSLNAAAKQLAIPPSTLTRRLQKLEQTLGCKLLSRSARRMVATEEGLQYYQHCRPLINSLLETTTHLDKTLTELKGTLRILAPINLANGLLSIAWHQFMQRYPEIDLELDLNNRTEDLIGKGFDLAIRTGKQADSLLNARKIGEIRTNVLVAAPEFIDRIGPISPQKIYQYPAIVVEPLAHWQLQHQDQPHDKISLHPKAHFRVNEMSLALTIAKQGHGLLYCPLSIAYEALQVGSLIQVLPEYISLPREIFVIWPQQHLLSARVRAMIDHLVAFSDTDPLLKGQ